MPSRLTRSLDVLLAVASTTGFVGLCVAVVRRSPENHVGFSPWLLIAAPAAALLVDLVRLAQTRRVRTSTAIIAAACVLTLGSLLVADRWNVLVPYETWVKRGMPAAWR